MGIVAERLKVIKPSPTLAVTKKANELKAEGKDIIALSVGEPDFDTPEFIKNAAKAAMDAGDTKYTNVDGTPALKKAIQAKFKRENNLDYSLNQIIVGTGGKQVLYNAMLASINPGDEVIIPAPYWVSYIDIVALAEGTPVIIECPEEDSFRLKPEILEKHITPKTKWLILGSPSNPSGAAYSEAELKSIAEVLLKYPHVNILSDDIYEHLIYDNHKFYTIAQIEPRLKDRTLTLNGVSKSYSMTGWRIGYAGGHEDLIKAMGVLQSQSTSNPSSISQAAAVAALNGDQSFLNEWREVFRKRRNFIVDQINSIPGLTCLKPEGAFYVFPSCKNLLGKTLPNGTILQNSNDFASYLLEDALVAVVPGIAFGAEGYFRISYATSDEKIKTACERIKASIAKIN